MLVHLRLFLVVQPMMTMNIRHFHWPALVVCGILQQYSQHFATVSCEQREKNGFPTKQMSSCHTCEVDRFNPGSLSKAIGKSCACVCVPWSNHIGSIASGHPSYHGNPYSGYPCQSIAKRINHALTMAAVITVRAFLPGFPNFYSMREYRPEVPVREMSSAGHP